MDRYSSTTTLLFAVGRIFSPIYAICMRLRAVFYQSGIIRRHRLPVPVISVGNLILGGTGKTPLVQYIARRLIRGGFLRPAVLSRGYGGRARAQINVVADEKDILLDAVVAGDEPRLLAEKMPGVPVITGSKRFVTGNYAINQLGADSIILDDGFQHLAVQRDMDLVLFNADTLLSTQRVLPGGDLREPVSALHRAGAFVITDVTAANRTKANAFKLHLTTLFQGKPIFSGSYQPASLLRKTPEGDVSSTSLAEIVGLPLYGFCGLANPDSFHQLLTSGKCTLADFQVFPDHFSYTAKEIHTISEQARLAGAKALITTAKDFVKLKALGPFDLPLLVLEIELKMETAFDAILDHFIAKHLERKIIQRQ
jgi:tetraacyldisaccharide 4'-kinase